MIFLKDVRERENRFLIGEKREKEKKVYIDYEVPELDSKHPICYDVIAGKSFIYKIGNSRGGNQIHLLTTFLKSGAKMWTLEDFWTETDVLTCHFASVSDFSCSHEKISVS